MGPVIIFDKSILQALSIDESCWLDNFFLSNLTPLFYIESLADLSKETKDRRTPEQFVSQLAAKTPVMNCYPNIHHQKLIIDELFGKEIPMDGRPLIGGGKSKITKEGETLVDHEQFPEVEALNRWQDEKFTELENEFAHQWRESLNDFGFNSKIAIVKNIVPTGTRLTTLEIISNFAKDFVAKEGEMILELMFNLLDINETIKTLARQRWQFQSAANLIEFAPYTAFVLTIEIFFYLALHFGQISKVRQSNKIDLAYLYYLPFCNVFTSLDGLHARVVPLFLRDDQEFIPGKEIKEVMQWLDQYYSNLPDDTKAQGVMRFASYPPVEDNLVSRLWDRYLTIWRKHLSEEQSKPPLTKEEQKELVDKLNRIKDESQPLEHELESDDVESVMFTQSVKARRGKWKLFPPEVTEKV